MQQQAGSCPSCSCTSAHFEHGHRMCGRAADTPGRAAQAGASQLLPCHILCGQAKMHQDDYIMAGLFYNDIPCGHVALRCCMRLLCEGRREAEEGGLPFAQQRASPRVPEGVECVWWQAVGVHMRYKGGGDREEKGREGETLTVDRHGGEQRTLLAQGRSPTANVRLA